MEAKITFGNGCAISDNMFYVPSFLDELEEGLEHTRIFVLNTEMAPYWFYHDVYDSTIIATCLRAKSDKSERACYSLSNNGLVEIFNSNSTITEDVFHTANRISYPGELTGIKYIAGHAYACGSGNQVYKSTEDGWVSISDDIQRLASQQLSEVITEINGLGPLPSTKNSGLKVAAEKLRDYTILHGIDGLAENSIYTCGSNGRIWHWDGAIWKIIKSGTVQHLHDVHCVSDELVFICGHNGVILKGNHRSGFSRLPTGNTKTNFWSIRASGEKIYVGSSVGLFEVAGNKVAPCATAAATPSSYSVQSIDVFNDTLWVAADKFILRLHNDQWSFIEHPDNV